MQGTNINTKDEMKISLSSEDNNPDWQAKRAVFHGTGRTIRTIVCTEDHIDMESNGQKLKPFTAGLSDSQCPAEVFRTLPQWNEGDIRALKLATGILLNDHRLEAQGGEWYTLVKAANECATDYSE